MTIHITPESRFSYASFESNTPQSRNMELIERVLALFRPANFIVTAFAKKMSTESKDTHVELQTAPHIGEFSRREIQFLSCTNCDLTYARYEK
jgi:acetolactate synthase regulatory subunit